MSSKFAIKGLMHVSVLVGDTQRALDFYHGLLGMGICDDRPDLGFPGAWLKLGELEFHIMELPNPDPIDGRPEHGGRDRHVAMAIDDVDGLKVVLDQAGIPYTSSRSGRAAIFCRDPDGNALEFTQTA